MIYKNVLMKTPNANNDSKQLAMMTTPNSSQYKEGFAEIIKRQLLAAQMVQDKQQVQRQQKVNTLTLK